MDTGMRIIFQANFTVEGFCLSMKKHHSQAFRRHKSVVKN